jgi:hypothetical protein
MRYYGSFIRIDGDGFAKPTLYEQTVLDLINTVSRTRTGLLVLYEIKNSGHRLRITPAASLLAADANPGNSHPSRKSGSSNVYRALSASSRLAFSPGDYDARAGRFTDSHPYYKATDTLVHELLHEARQMQGLFQAHPTNDPYENIEEFYAITVANIYASEIGANNRLRGSHAPAFEPLKITNSQAFEDKYVDRLTTLNLQMGTFCRLLSQVAAQFNPLRVHYAELPKQF